MNSTPRENFPLRAASVFSLTIMAYSAVKRRQTLASIVDPTGNNVPSSAIHNKRASMAAFSGPMPPRLSLGPTRAAVKNAGISGFGGNADGFSTGGGPLGLGSSMAAGMATPAPHRNGGGKRQSGAMSVNRRSSTFTGRPSTSGTGRSGDIKDPRPVRDKNWQHNVIRTIINYLARAGYNQAISTKTLQTPTSKDFQSIFKFLYARIDPNFVFQKKIEEEVPVLLKALKYPFLDQISKSQLYAVGSMHSWPTLLAMLGWMVELIVCLDRMNGDQESDEFTDVENHNQGNDGTVGTNDAEKYFFEYLCQAYRRFLVGEDDFGSIEEEMARKFDMKNDSTIREIQRLEKENEYFKQELINLHENEPPLVSLEKEREVLQSDKEKFVQYIQHLESKRNKLHEFNRRLKQETASAKSELSRLHGEKIHYQSIVDAQEISPADVDRMTAEREQLRKQIENATGNAETASKATWEREIAVQKRLDGLERSVNEYNSAAERLGVMGNPEFSKDDGGSGMLELNVHAGRPEYMVSVDLKNKIKPALFRLRQTFNADFHSAQDELILLTERIDRLAEALSDKQEEVIGTERRVTQTNEQYTEQKQVIHASQTQSNAEMASLDTELRKMKMDGSASLLAAKQRTQKLTIEYDQLLRKSHERKENAGKEIIRILEDLVGFKTHVEQSLADLERTACDEANSALEELEAERISAEKKLARCDAQAAVPTSSSNSAADAEEGN